MKSLSLLVACTAVHFARAQTIYFTHGETRTPLEVGREYPHDDRAFTQGFEIHDGVFWETTGMRGQSTLRIVDINTGSVLHSTDLESAYFGEGMTLWEDTIYVLTWTSNTGFTYNRDLQRTGNFSYSTQGWGLTHDDTHLIRSDGSSTLHFHDPKTFEEVRTVTVTSNGATQRNLNELEMIGGYVLANVWYDTRIAIIDPESGVIVAWLECAALKNLQPRQDVLNGIAYDEESNRLFLTGKYWTRVYELEMPDLSQVATSGATATT